MRMSRLFGRTLREAPASVEEAGLQLLVRAGMVRPVAGGLHALLPLGHRALSRLDALARQEIERLGGQEVWLPSVQPADWFMQPAIAEWRPYPTSFTDKSDRDYALAADGAALLARLAGPEVRSYRQLPAVLFSVRDRWQDGRGRGGLLEARESRVVETLTLGADDEAAEQAGGPQAVYAPLFSALGIAPLSVSTLEGVTLFYPSARGEETILVCESCGYLSLVAEAMFAKPAPAAEAPRPVEKVATPGTKTIADLAALLGVPTAQTAKAVFVMGAMGGAERFIFAIVRGDMDVSEAKLARAAGASSLRPATPDEIRAAGAVPGYASPVGLKGVAVIVDDLVARSPNLVAGANEEGYHLLNTNLDRDYQATRVSDIVEAHAGDQCPHCADLLQARSGVVLGSSRRLSFVSNATPLYLDAQGRTQPVSMTAFRLDLLRTLACVAEQHRDDQGLIWPVAAAPYEVHLVLLGGGEAEAETVYSELTAAGIGVLFDDRSESAGVKFADADLIGIPVRLTIGKRSLQQGGVELKARNQAERRLVPLGDIASQVREELLASEAGREK
jgi:prolyl-tRNA synthetase